MAHERARERRLAGAVGAHQRVDLAARDVEVDALEDLVLLDADVKVAYLEVGHRARQMPVAAGVSEPRCSSSHASGAACPSTAPPAAGSRITSASVVSCRVCTIARRTFVHRSFVGHTCPGSDSRAHTIDPSGASEMHSIGALDPSSAETTSAIVISAGERASM